MIKKKALQILDSHRAFFDQFLRFRHDTEIESYLVVAPPTVCIPALVLNVRALSTFLSVRWIQLE